MWIRYRTLVTIYVNLDYPAPVLFRTYAVMVCTPPTPGDWEHAVLCPQHRDAKVANELMSTEEILLIMRADGCNIQQNYDRLPQLTVAPVNHMHVKVSPNQMISAPHLKQCWLNLYLAGSQIKSDAFWYMLYKKYVFFVCFFFFTGQSNLCLWCTIPSKLLSPPSTLCYQTFALVRCLLFSPNASLSLPLPPSLCSSSLLGSWSARSCRAVPVHSFRTKCVCDSVSTFAILARVNLDSVSPPSPHDVFSSPTFVVVSVGGKNGASCSVWVVF